MVVVVEARPASTSLPLLNRSKHSEQGQKGFLHPWCSPPTPTCEGFRCSCNLVFGSWEPHELASVLNLPECSCASEVSATIRFVGNQDLVANSPAFSTAAGDSDSDDDTVISYYEWISRRPIVKLPPGLPRPPRQSAFTPVSAAVDDDLEDECDAWYERHVTSGNFPDWIREEQRVFWDASSAYPPSAHAGGCSNEDREAECDDWLNRNVPAATTWLATNSGTRGLAPDAPSHEVKTPHCKGLASASGIEAGSSDITKNVEKSPSSLLESSPCTAGYTSGHNPNSLPALDCTAIAGRSYPAARLSIAVPDFSVGNDENDDDSCCGSLSSPVGSDCRTTATSEDYSRGSSRSCSCLSLGSLDSGCAGGCSSCDEGEEEGPRDAGDGRDRVFLLGLGRTESPCAWEDGGSRTCTQSLDVDEAGVALVQLVECASWELEVEAKQRQILPVSPRDGWDGLDSGLQLEHGYGHRNHTGGVQAWGNGSFVGCNWEGAEGLASSNIWCAWIDSQLDGLLRATVERALFDEVSEEKMVVYSKIAIDGLII